MAAPLTAARQLAALRAEGCRVVEYRSWRSNNRNHRGLWGPVHGVMIHHTVTSGTNSSVALCYEGHSSLPGPLCHTVGAKDGTLYMVGCGRANHAGSGDSDVLRAVINETALPPDNQADTDGNRHFYGIELINRGDGRDPWPSTQVDAAARWAAALCRAHGWSERSVIGHLEWQPGKIDPRGFTMSSFRARVKQLLANPPGTGTGTPEDDVPTYIRTPGETDMSHTGRTWHTLEFQDNTKNILTGPKLYTLDVNLYLDDVPDAAEIQGRFIHRSGDDTSYGPVIEALGTAGKSFPQFSKKGRLRSGESLQFQLIVHADGRFKTTRRIAEGHVWT